MTATASESADKFLSCAQVVKLLPPGRNSRYVSVATITRWILTGCRATDGTRVRLRAVRNGYRWVMRKSWLDEFFDALNPDGLKSTNTPRSPAIRQRAIANADRELAARARI